MYPPLLGGTVSGQAGGPPNRGPFTRTAVTECVVYKQYVVIRFKCLSN